MGIILYRVLDNYFYNLLDLDYYSMCIKLRLLSFILPKRNTLSFPLRKFLYFYINSNNTNNNPQFMFLRFQIINENKFLVKASLGNFIFRIFKDQWPTWQIFGFKNGPEYAETNTTPLFTVPCHSIGLYQHYSNKLSTRLFHSSEIDRHGVIIWQCACCILSRESVWRAHRVGSS